MTEEQAFNAIKPIVDQMEDGRLKVILLAVLGLWIATPRSRDDIYETIKEKAIYWLAQLKKELGVD